MGSLSLALLGGEEGGSSSALVQPYWVRPTRRVEPSVHKFEISPQDLDCRKCLYRTMVHLELTRSQTLEFNICLESLW
jgi:hypothetical protein